MEKVSQVSKKYFNVLVALQKLIFNYMLEVLRPRKKCVFDTWPTRCMGKNSQNHLKHLQYIFFKISIFRFGEYSAEEFTRWI